MQIPYSHAIASYLYKFIDYEQYVDPYYSLEMTTKCCGLIFNPFGHLDLLDRIIWKLFCYGLISCTMIDKKIFTKLHCRYLIVIVIGLLNMQDRLQYGRKCVNESSNLHN